MMKTRLEGWCPAKIRSSGIPKHKNSNMTALLYHKKIFQNNKLDHKKLFWIRVPTSTTGKLAVSRLHYNNKTDKVIVRICILPTMNFKSISQPKLSINFKKSRTSQKNNKES